MIVIALCAVLVVAIATLAIGTHRSRQHPGSHRETEHPGWDDESIATLHGTLPATEQTIMAAPVDGHPPWDTAPWAAGWAPDPETAVLIREAERDHRREQAWPASGNGHVTAAEPLAPLPPAATPAEPVASAPAHPASTGETSAPEAASLSPATGARPDAVTLLDERQQLIDHAKKLIAAAKVDRILGGVMADA